MPLAPIRLCFALPLLLLLPRPAAAALPAGVPTLAEFEAATASTPGDETGPGAGLTPMRDADGAVLTIGTTDGVYGDAFTDAAGNTIVDFQYSLRPEQYRLAVATLAGEDPATLPGYAEALGFVARVAALAAAQDRDPSRLFLTGFSEGAMLASYVGWRTGRPGCTFASSGLPGYASNGVPADNFVSFLESGDPVAQYGTDAILRGSAIVAAPRMDHYGLVVQLGTPGTDIAAFAASLDGHSIAQVLDGTSTLSSAEVVAIVDAESVLQTRYHDLGLYFPDADAVAAAHGDD